MAPLPLRGELAAAPPPDAGADRGPRLGRGVLQRPGRGDVPHARRQPPPRSRRPRARPVPRRRRPRPVRRAADVVRRPPAQPGRGPPRPARVLRRRQRLPLRGAVVGRAEPVRPDRQPARVRRRAPRQPGRQAAAGQPAPRRADHRARRQGRAGRLRPQRAALPALQRDDRGPPGRRARPDAVLVPGLPGPPRSPPRRARTAGRWTATRRRPSSSTTSPGAAPAERAGAGRQGTEVAAKSGGCDFTANLVPAPCPTSRAAASGTTDHGPAPFRRRARFLRRRPTRWRWPAGRSCSTPCTTDRGRR